MDKPSRSDAAAFLLPEQRYRRDSTFRRCPIDPHPPVVLVDGVPYRRE